MVKKNGAVAAEGSRGPNTIYKVICDRVLWPFFVMMLTPRRRTGMYNNWTHLQRADASLFFRLQWSVSDDLLLFSGTDSRPVYEMICRDVAVMRRRSDAYLNATQILKVAGFDKPQRTRVLEREVQKGEHEKVQGGYGKYQGECGLCIA